MLRYDLFPAGRKFVDHGNIEIAVERHGERARNRRCGHDQHVRRHALLHQLKPLHHTETMLLVDDYKAQFL